MTIAHIIQSFSLGGGPRALYYICCSLPNVKFVIYGCKGVMIEDFYKLSNVEIRFIEKWNLGNSLKIYKTCIKENVDIMHFHNIFPSIYFAFFNQIPKIITFHGLHIRKYDYIKSYVKKYFRLLIKNLLVIKFDAVIVLCESDKKYLINLLINRKMNSKIVVIPNAALLDLSKTDSISDSCMSAQGLKLVVVARFAYPKGHDILIDMLEKIADKDRFFNIYFIGDKKVQQLVDDGIRNGCNNIYYLKETNRPYSFMKKADFLLLPSRWEGLPMVVLEALLLGTKVIAADTANINYLADDRNVFLYKQYDVNNFLKVLKQCNDKKNNVVDINMSEFSLKNVGEKTLDLYKKMRG